MERVKSSRTHAIIAYFSIESTIFFSHISDVLDEMLDVCWTRLLGVFEPKNRV